MQRTLLALLLLSSTWAVEAITPMPALVSRTITGWTTPLRTLDLAAEVAGRVREIPVQPGQRLTDGMVVVRLDSEMADLAVGAAEAAAGDGRGQVESAAGAVAAAEATLLARRADSARRADEGAQAQRNRQRVQDLHQQQLSSEQLLEESALAVSQATQASQAALADLAAAAASLVQAKAGQSVAAARLTGLENSIAQAKALRARHDIAAPGAWVVRERLAEPGAVVAAGTPLLRLADTSTLVVALRLSEDEIAALRARDAALTLTVVFARGNAVPARLRQVDVAFDPASRKRLVELVISGAAAPEPSGGLAAELRLEIADPSGGLAVPEKAIDWRIEQPWVRLADGREQPVVVLRRGGGLAVIAPGSLPVGATLLPPAAPTTLATPATLP